MAGLKLEDGLTTGYGEREEGGKREGRLEEKGRKVERERKGNVEIFYKGFWTCSIAQ